MINLYSEEQQTLTPYLFYNEILEQLHGHYEEEGNIAPTFSLMETSYLEPMVVPLIVELGAYLKKHHKGHTVLCLSNTPTTGKMLNFLDKIDFFKIVGEENNPLWTKARDIFDYSKKYLGGHRISNAGEIRDEHKLRVYDRIDKDINLVLKSGKADSKLRDDLIDYFSIKVEQDFGDMFNDKESILENRFLYVEVLAELLTNSIYHGKSIVSALMHTNKYKTSLSIADIGSGFTGTINKKENVFSSNMALRKKYAVLANNDFVCIFDTLFYSFHNKRRGLLDLILLVLNQSGGVFRIHNNSCQLILTARYQDEINELTSLRETIYKELKGTKNVDDIKNKAYKEFVEIISKTQKFYSGNFKYSTARFFDVGFPGVHIEVEIVN